MIIILTSGGGWNQYKMHSELGLSGLREAVAIARQAYLQAVGAAQVPAPQRGAYQQQPPAPFVRIPGRRVAEMTGSDSAHRPPKQSAMAVAAWKSMVPREAIGGKTGAVYALCGGIVGKD